MKNMKLALAAVCVVVSGCAGTPRWDTSQFPHQPIYDGTSEPTQVAQEQKK